MLIVRLLGRVSVALDGVELTAFGSGPLLRLITGLVLRAGVPIARTELAFRLWPDSTEAQARTNLRKAVHHLRQELDGADRFVDVTHSALCWLADAPADVDVMAFTSACDAGDDGGAMAAYRGDLLPGVYDEWILDERARLHGLAVAALTRLVEGAGHDHTARLASALRLIELEPTSEWAHRHVIETYAQRGDRASAIRAYHRCAELLSTELGVEPSADTQAVYARLVDTRTPVTGPLPRPAPLIGREPEWATLGLRWDRVGADPMHLVVVTGEAGVGKSRLVAEFARTARASGALVLRARSYEAVDASWAPVAAWLGTEELSSLLADAPSALLSDASRLAPHLRTRDDVPAPTPVTDDVARFQFTEALASAIMYGTAARLLVLDDVHWCDAPTLGLVAHIMHSRPGAPALVVALARPEELADDHPFARMRDALVAEGRVTVLELGRLSRAETALVADAVAPATLTPGDHDLIWAESEGNPLFAVELAKSEPSWVETGQVAPAVRAVIEGRLRRLGDEARRVAEAAALLGGEFSHTELEAVVGDPSQADRLVGALDELWRRQIIAETRRGYDFTHDKLREVAAAGVGAVRRRQLHGDIADALASLHGTDRMGGRIANHLREAGRYAEAIDALRRASRADLELFDLDLSVDALRTALGLVAELTARDDAAAVEQELLIDLGAVLVAREGYGSTAVRDVYTRSMAIARSHRSAVDPAILRGLGLAAVVGCRFEEASRLAQQLIETVGDPVARIEGHYLLGVTTFWQGDLERSAHELEASMHAYDPDRREVHQSRFTQDPYPVCLVRLALTRFWQGDEPASIDLAERALAWCERTGHRHSTAYVLAYIGMLATERHDIDQLREATIRGRELWSEAKGFFAAFAPLYDGWLGVLGGDGSAAQDMDAAAEDWRQSGQVLHLTHGLVLRARAALKFDDIGAADQAVREARRRTEATGQSYLLSEIDRLGAITIARTGGPDSARADLDRAIGVASEQGAAGAELRARVTRLVIEGTGRADVEALLDRSGGRLPATVVREAQDVLHAHR